MRPIFAAFRFSVPSGGGFRFVITFGVKASSSPTDIENQMPEYVDMGFF